MESSDNTPNITVFEGGEPEGSVEKMETESGAGTHPWKVTANGDDTVTVAAGKILSYLHDEVTAGADYLPACFQLKKLFDYAGTGETPIVVTGTGKIYVSVAYTEGGNVTRWDADPGDGLEEGRSYSIVPDTGAALTVSFATSLPADGDAFVVEIADVSLADGVAQVDDQILTHNPTLVAWASDTPGSPA